MSEQWLTTPLFTGPQETALRVLAGGAHIFEAAHEAQVRRETVSRWMADEAFRAELARRREELWAQYRDQLTQMAPIALYGLEMLIRGPDYVGREFFDPRVQLDAIRLVLSISGLLPRAGPALAVQVNVVQQQINGGQGNE